MQYNIRYNLTGILVMMVIALNMGCEQNRFDEIIPVNDSTDHPGNDSVRWGERTDLVFRSWMDLYWDESRQVFYSDPYQSATKNYWWWAHALDALVDEAVRREDSSLDSRIREFYQGISQQNNGFINHFYDDMCWMGLAMLRAHELTGEEQYLETSRLLWNDIITGWNAHQGGGIAWNKQQLTYKNTPSNAPAAILSFRLFRLLDDSTYFHMGEDIMAWQQSTLVEEQTGMVWDGIGRDGGSAIDYSWLFTYNQGTYMGACLEYYQVTGNTTWFNRAVKTADQAISNFSNEDHILVDEGAGDGGLFKGILVRYLHQLMLSPRLDERRAEAYRDFLFTNARQLWEVGQTTVYPYEFNSNWNVPATGGADLSVYLSAVFLFESVALPEDPA